MAFWSDYSRRWDSGGYSDAKIFLRSDLFRRHAGMGTADFAKLAANRADLTWSDGALLGMLAKRDREHVRRPCHLLPRGTAQAGVARTTRWGLSR